MFHHEYTLFPLENNGTKLLYIYLSLDPEESFQ